MDVSESVAKTHRKTRRGGKKHKKRAQHIDEFSICQQSQPPNFYSTPSSSSPHEGTSRTFIPKRPKDSIVRNAKVILPRRNLGDFMNGVVHSSTSTESFGSHRTPREERRTSPIQTLHRNRHPQKDASNSRTSRPYLSGTTSKVHEIQQDLLTSFDPKGLRIKGKPLLKHERLSKRKAAILKERQQQQKIQKNDDDQPIEYNNEVFVPQHRESLISIQSTLSLSDDTQLVSTHPIVSKPIDLLETVSHGPRLCIEHVHQEQRIGRMKKMDILDQRLIEKTNETLQLEAGHRMAKTKKKENSSLWQSSINKVDPIHRPYINQYLSEELDSKLREYLRSLNEMQKSFLQKSNVTNSMRRRLRWNRRFITGFSETAKAIRSRTVQCVVIVPNLEPLDEIKNTVMDLMKLCNDVNVPIVFGLSRNALGKVSGRSTRQSCIAILNTPRFLSACNPPLLDEILQLSKSLRLQWEKENPICSLSTNDLLPP